MSKMKLTLGYMAALLLFTACTQDEAGTLPDGGWHMGRGGCHHLIH